MNHFFIILCILGIALGDVSHLRSSGYQYSRKCTACQYSTAPTIVSYTQPQRSYVTPGYQYSSPAHQSGYQYSSPVQYSGYQYSSPVHNSGYQYSPPPRVINIPSFSTPRFIAPVREFLPRNYIPPIAAAQPRYFAPEAINSQENYISPLAGRTISAQREGVRYKQAYVQPSQPEPSAQKSFGPPPDPYAYTPPKKTIITGPPPNPPQPETHHSNTKTGYNYEKPTIPFNSVSQKQSSGTLKTDGYHYDKPSVPFNPPAPQITPTPKHVSTGSGILTSDGYHYDKPSIPFNPVLSHTSSGSGTLISSGYSYDKPQVKSNQQTVTTHISPGKLTSDGYHYDKPSIPFNPVPNTAATTITSDGYHYDKPQGDYSDNGLNYRKIRRVIYRYKKK